METMDARLIAQALNYHGQQLQKVWESERNESELQMLNLKEPSFEIYQQRQKTLSFSDRGKRLKLQQFIAKKADALYDKSNLLKTCEPIKQERGDHDYYATMPGLDSFVAMEKSQRIRNFLESLVVGDVIFAQVMGKSAAGLLLKVLCNSSDFPRVVPDLGVKALILNTATVPAVDKKGVTRGYMANDLVCVVVGEVNVEAERVVAVMNVAPREGHTPHPAMGLIHTEDLPEAYKKAMDNKGQNYETIMENSPGFNNPNNIKYLCDLIGLGQNNCSNMVGLREKFPVNEYATELRQAQASKWAFRSVAEGIDHFKAGRHTEAFQCLNKALTVDPRNVEGLVARGALYANSGSFKKAIDDFETALKLNPTHANARKYMAETLVALGRSYEDEKKFDDALKAYENCLTIAPYHEEARNSIDYIKSKNQPPSLTSNLEPFKPSFESEIENIDILKDKKKRKKERKSRSKKHQRWSSSSSSSSASGSSSESSSSEASGSSSSSGSSRTNSRSSSRRRKSKKDHHESSSLSPLSKRMAHYNNPPAAITAGPPAGLHSYDMFQPGLHSTSNSRDKEDYEQKVRKFLEQTKDDSDYEEKVRKFLEETARWKKEKEKEKKLLQQQQLHSTNDMEKSKKKKKKEKKAKDKNKDKEEKKMRKKKKKEERKKRKNKDKLERDLQTTIPDLGELDAKINAYYNKVEKEMSANKSTDKFGDSTRRDDRDRERDDGFKSYHDRDPRLSLPPPKKDAQRKAVPDLFDQDLDAKLPSVEQTIVPSKWKAVQSSRRDAQSQKWSDLTQEKKLKAPMDSEDEDVVLTRSLEKSILRKRDSIDKRTNLQVTISNTNVPPPKELPAKQLSLKYPAQFGSKDVQIAAPATTSKFSHLGSKFQPIGRPESPPVQRPPSKAETRPSKGKSRSTSQSPRRKSRDDIVGPRSPPKRLSRRSRSRSRDSRPSRSISRSRSRSGSPRHSRSNSRRRSGSYERKFSRSPSGTYSRSRSRSRSDSRSRSRSRSADRFRRRFRQFNNRGTYYKPRFTPFNNQSRPGGFQNRNRFFDRRDQNRNRFNNQRYPQNRRNDMMNRNRNAPGGRYYGRPGGGFRDHRRRDYRDRRSRSYSRSYSPDPMRKVDEAKEKINKMIEDGATEGNGERTSKERSVSKRRSSRPPTPREEEDYERWGVEEDLGDKSKLVSAGPDILGKKDDFIQRMKQRSQNVLIKRAIEAKTWYRPPPT